MKRTVKIWLAAVMSGVLLAGGAAMKMCIRDSFRTRKSRMNRFRK